ncbi:MAG: VanZ family protein [Oscillospiraceae bacterium]|nr:VanZ family protein [Oscillospiraceae bacterium]
MIKIPFLLTEGIFTAVWILCRIVVWLQQKRIDWKREAVLLLMYINLAVIIRFTFFPMSLVNGHVRPLLFNPSAVFPFWINWTPFVHLSDFARRKDFYLNIIGNVAMFIPSGIVLPVVYKQLNTFGKVLLAGAGLSLCIEILQLPFSVRASDIDDLILNTAGVVIGYGIYALFQFIKRRRS